MLLIFIETNKVTNFVDHGITFVLLINTVLYATVYIMYLFAITANYSNIVVTLVQYGIAIFKLIGNRSVSVHISRMYASRGLSGSYFDISSVPIQ